MQWNSYANQRFPHGISQEIRGPPPIPWGIPWGIPRGIPWRVPPEIPGGTRLGDHPGHPPRDATERLLERGSYFGDRSVGDRG